MGDLVYKNYLGFNRQIAPSDLGRFEDKGFIMQEKYDGWWCCAEADENEVSCFSRSGLSLTAAEDKLVSDLFDFKGVVVGEWLPEDEIFYAYDLLEYDAIKTLPSNYRFVPLEERLWALNDLFKDAKHIIVAPYFTEGFTEAYKAIMEDGGEGVALKNEKSLYHSRLKSRKTSHWIKCKPKYERSTADNFVGCNDSGHLFTISGGG
jgi:ATP-dependent DNA ligase